MKLIKRDQKGLASIVVVVVLVALLSLISIGFARLMDRAVNSSLNNQLSTSAGYAAQSGINDTIAYVQAHPNCATTTPATCSSTNCNAIFGTPPNGISQNFVGSNNSSLKYNCILVNPTPPFLTYSQIPASESQVTEINPVDSSGNPVPAGSLLFSWQADGSDSGKTTLGCSSPTLYDENTWSGNNCPPLLRVSLYPVSGTTVSQGHTYFLYPNNSGVSNNTFAYSNTDGSTVPVNCNVNGSQTISGFSGSLDEQCNVVISGLPSADSFYARITPIYDQTTVKIKANDSSGNVLTFKGDQSLIDVTAQAGTATKRLQAAVKISNSTDISPSDSALPEDGLRSAEAICKQLDNTGSTVVNKANTSDCPLSINQPQPPVVNFCVDDGSSCDPSTNLPNSTNIADQGSVTLRWNISGADTCDSTTATGSTINWGGPVGDGSSPSPNGLSVGPLSGGSSGTTYTFKINCSNIAGPASGTVTVNVSPTSGGTTCTGCSCDDSCGSGGGGGGIEGFQFDPSKPNDDAFLVSVQNVGQCHITAYPDGLQGDIFFPQNQGTNAPIDLGPGSATQATADCGANGSLSASRNGVGCANYPVWDGWDYIECVGESHVHCGPYECVICYNPNGSQDYEYCEPWSESVPGCTDPAADNYNPLANVNDGSCTYGNGNGSPPPPDCGSLQDAEETPPNNETCCVYFGGYWDGDPDDDCFDIP